MNKKFIITGLFLSVITQSIFSQKAKLSYDFKTGDKELDISLNKINIDAKSDINNFIKNISTSYKVESKKIQKMLQSKMEPADIVMTLDIAQISGNSVEAIAEEYKENKEKGWGQIAKNMGIKPGSPEFHQLKQRNKKNHEKNEHAKNKGEKNKHRKGNHNKGND